ncbi:MAG: deoxyribodipyrimidine photo-lyase [Bacteroidetes bacterium]|nr:deoxyribodipyrimidine photo-lyase [Bacteroidota bacterium]
MSDSPRTSIVWFRRDLRAADNHALHAAVTAGERILPLYILSDDDEQPWAIGAAQRWWVHHSLIALRSALADARLTLVVRKGGYASTIADIARACNADVVRFNRRFEPHAVRSDGKVIAALKKEGLDVRIHEGSLLHDPDEFETKSGGPYRVFTPFWKHLQRDLKVPRPLPAPGKAVAAAFDAAVGDIDDLELLPTINWTEGIAKTWTPGEKGAAESLAAFADSRVMQYGDRRDLPGEVTTSRMSPYLANGELSPRQIWHRIAGGATLSDAPKGVEPYLRQLAWREFSYHILHHNPNTPSEPLYEKFEAFPWKRSRSLLEKWQKGQTGYPIVDAGMRELWETGWMHNRVRMVVASFLTKHLLINWRHGAAWFWDTLVDADLANNTMGWQWSAGCGADAQPYFRIFNPILQGRKFDKDGTYVRRWVPELAALPNTRLDAPWDAGDEELADAGVALGDDYPTPVVEHSEARDRALDAYEKVKAAAD